MFFILSKIFGLLILPSSLLAIVTCILLVVGTAKRLPVWLGMLICTVYGILLVPPVGDWVLAPLEEQIQNGELPQHLDGIIVLGGAIDTTLTAERGMVALNDAAERLTVVQPLQKQFPDARIIFTGGSGRLWDQQHHEADDAKTVFMQWGLPLDNMIFERDSRNTFENVAYSKKWLVGQADEKWLLVTSASHMPRAMAIFNKADWPVIPYKVDYRARLHPNWLCLCMTDNLQKIDQWAHELTGSAVYRLTGKI